MPHPPRERRGPMTSPARARSKYCKRRILLVCGLSLFLRKIMRVFEIFLGLWQNCYKNILTGIVLHETMNAIHWDAGGGNVLSTVISDVTSQSSEDEKFVASFGTCNVEIDEPCSSEKVVFYIYPDDSTENPTGVTALDRKLESYFNESRETKILIHGYVGNASSKNTALLRKVYVQQNKFNVVVVDWGELVKLPCYPVAVFSTWQAGKCIAIFLENFISHGDFQKVHAVGFSLGAHVAAFASNRLNEKTEKKLGRITGLDPALPFFASLEKAMKLDKEDGGFVDVIHTNVGVFGKIEPTGHVDFYMNGGFTQPACEKANNVLLCSHLMAVVYFAETVVGSGRGFWGIPCASHFQYVIGLCNEYSEESRVEMGENCDHRSRGVYFVKTSDRPPYALG